MRKLNLIIGLFIIMALMLTACDGLQVDENGNGTDTAMQETDEVFAEGTEALETPAETPDAQVTEGAAEETPGSDETETVPETGLIDGEFLTYLLRFDVSDTNREVFGEVDDFILNIDNQQIDYAVIDVGGFLGIGSRQIVVPYGRLQISDQPVETDDVQENETEQTTEAEEDDDLLDENDREMVYYMEVTQEELESAPDFDQNTFPRAGDPLAEDWDSEYRNFWGEVIDPDTDAETDLETETPEAQETADAEEVVFGTEYQGVVLASRLLDMDVFDADANYVAFVSDMVIEPESGEIRHLMLDTFGFAGAVDQTMLVAPDVVSWRYEFDDNLLIAPDLETLLDAAVPLVDVTPVAPEAAVTDSGRISNLLQFDVFGPNGDEIGEEKIGDIHELIINIDNQQIEYVVVTFGGFLGLGESEIVVPYDRLQLPEIADPAFDQYGIGFFRMDITQEELEEAPEFDREALPNIGEEITEDWDIEYRSFWGEDSDSDTNDQDETETQIEDNGSAVTELQGLVLASEILGMNIRSEAGDELANVDEVIVDPESGEVRYMVLNITGIEELDDQIMAIPLSGVSWYYHAEDEVLILEADEQLLAEAPTFEENLLPVTTEEGWDSEVAEYWERNN